MLMDFKILAKKFAFYAYYHLNCNSYDRIYFENILLSLFHEEIPTNEEINLEEIKKMNVPDTLIEELYTLLKKKDESFATKIMGILTKSPSEIISQFEKSAKETNTDVALEDFYNLQIKNYYIRKNEIDKNIVWSCKYEYPLEITINLSRPEKDNKEIKKNTIQKEEIYPHCALCKENIGYAGNFLSSPRQNLRVIPLLLNNEKWFMQFSPYCYYPQHIIVINEKHTPMCINKNTFIRLCDFVDKFPMYFLGSNSDLPIVGGSILNHEHYQGGKHCMPLMKSKVKYEIFANKQFIINYIDWYNSVLSVESENRMILIEIMNHILLTWENYDDKDINIISHTKNIRHNTITPIVFKDKNRYKSYLILRNNRCNEQYPFGIFHAHSEYHFIKKEGIGLMESMGFFVLPGRLKKQMENIVDFFRQDKTLETFLSEHPDMYSFKVFLKDLMSRYPKNIDAEILKNVLKVRVEKICRNILLNTAVFPNTEEGKEHAFAFFKCLKFNE